MCVLPSQDPYLCPVNGQPVRVNNAASPATISRIAPPKPTVNRVVLTIISSARVRHVSYQIRIVLRTTSRVSKWLLGWVCHGHETTTLVSTDLHISGVGECGAKLAQHDREDLTVSIVTIALLV